MFREKSFQVKLCRISEQQQQQQKNNIKDSRNTIITKPESKILFFQNYAV